MEGEKKGRVEDSKDKKMKDDEKDREWLADISEDGHKERMRRKIKEKKTSTIGMGQSLSSVLNDPRV